MALINCPECETVVSDKAMQCPKCAYPISQLRVLQQQAEQAKGNIDPPQASVQQQTYNRPIPLASKKNEALAFLFPFLFGPLGLLYANTKKAINTFLIALVINFIIVITTYDTGHTFGFLLMSFITVRVISIIMSVKIVSRYNETIMEQANARSIKQNMAADIIDILWRLIQYEKDRSMYSQSRRQEILDLLKKNCQTKEEAILILNTYKERYMKDLDDELKSLSKAYNNIRENITVFIDFGILNDQFPHSRIYKMSSQQ